jgi:3-hydroxybutyryl-CoA dehydrogenase
MGSRIACQSILHGVAVRLFDIAPGALERAVEDIRRWVAERVEHRAAEIMLARLRVCADLQDCATGVQLIIENVPENLELKRRVFADIDAVAPPQALIATNSSSLPSSRLAEATTRPDKVFNINFTDPMAGSLLVEVMGHARTAPEAIATGEAFVRAIKMVPIVTKKEIMGFSFNRVWRAIKREMLHLVGDGYCDFEDLDRAWMLSYGLTWGPFGLMDRIGLDVIRDIEMQYYHNSGEERDKPPRFLEGLVAAGRLGVKTGNGFYRYPDPEYQRPGWLHKEPPWAPDDTIRLS